MRVLCDAMMTETSLGTRSSMTSAQQHPSRRVLVCAPFSPRLDARHGGRATAQLLLRLAERNEVALLCLRSPQEGPVDPEIASRCALLGEIPLAAKTRLSRRLDWIRGLVLGRPPWASDCRSTDYASALERLLDDWQPDVVEIHLQAMAQYIEAPARREMPSIL